MNEAKEPFYEVDNPLALTLICRDKQKRKTQGIKCHIDRETENYSLIST
jgi:hypothetical protein